MNTTEEQILIVVEGVEYFLAREFTHIKEVSQEKVAKIHQQITGKRNSVNLQKSHGATVS